MTWFVESPLPILFLGLAAEAILVVLLFQTGRGAMLLAMAGVGLVTGGLLAVEWFVVTDVERIESALYEAAAALRQNDTQAVLEQIAVDAVDVRQAVERGLAQFEIVEARITSAPDVQINRLTDPPTATAVFFGRLRVRPRRGGMVDGLPVGRFTVDLVRADQHWLVTGYQLRR